MKPYYEDASVTLYHADCRDVEAPAEVGCCVFDPPFDDGVLMGWAPPDAPTLLAFTDPRHMGETLATFGPPAWVFTWDTMSPWQTGPRRPLTQTKQCLFYGDLSQYDRDARLWGDAPPARNHPSTKQAPLTGRRLTDLWRESLRWLHFPGAGAGSTGTERFSQRQGDAAMRHAKPLGWIECLVENCSTGLVFDPCAGSGTALVAAKRLGRRAIGIEIDERTCEFIARRLSDDELPLFSQPTQHALTCDMDEDCSCDPEAA